MKVFFQRNRYIGEIIVMDTEKKKVYGIIIYYATYNTRKTNEMFRT